MDKPKSWILTVTADPNNPDDFILDLDALVGNLGWRPGDELEFVDNGDGSWTIKKKT